MFPSNSIMCAMWSEGEGDQHLKCATAHSHHLTELASGSHMYREHKELLSSTH